MAIPQLSDEQIRTWTLEQKDRWWLENVYRGDMPQLTWSSALTGVFLGAILSATNLYVGAKTGITLGVGLTSVILAFAMFKALSRIGVQDMTILENNCMQSIATSAGYMTMPLLSSLTAYMWITQSVIPWYQIMLWNLVLSVMGVLVAFPMKRRFINDEQQPFPEGRACGVVLDTLYTGSGALGMLQAKALVVAGLLTATIAFLSGKAYMTLIQWKLLKFKSIWWLTDQLDEQIFRLFNIMPTIGGLTLKDLGLRFVLHLDMIGTGGLMGVKTTTSLLIGAIANYAILAPILIHNGEIVPKMSAAGVPEFGRIQIFNTWAIWWSVTIMVVGSLGGLFAKPKALFGAFAGLFTRRRAGTTDVLGHIELPLWISFVGVPVLAAITAWMAWEFFGIHWYLALLSLPLTFALSLICANCMGLTSWTPTGALSKITQFTFGAIERTNPATNLMTAGITSEVASNSANLLSDIKPGYMLGAKPRQQAIGHVIGIIVGAAASTPLFFVMFLAPDDNGVRDVSKMVTEQFAFPSAAQWKGVADIIAHGFKNLSVSIQLSMAIAAAAAIIFEVLRIVTRNRFPISSLGIGLGVVLPPDSTFMMWIGSMIFWGLAARYRRKPGTAGHTLWVQSHEPICAGIITGAALLGIGDKLVDVFILK